MGQSTDRNEVDAGLRSFADRRERVTPSGLDLDGRVDAADSFDSSAHRVGVHIVEHYAVGAFCKGVLDFSEIFGFNENGHRMVDGL